MEYELFYSFIERGFIKLVDKKNMLMESREEVFLDEKAQSCQIGKVS